MSDDFKSKSTSVQLGDGTVYWCFNGRLHREDGTAIENINGYKEWWIYDICINKLKDIFISMLPD